MIDDAVPTAVAELIKNPVLLLKTQVPEFSIVCGCNQAAPIKRGVLVILVLTLLQADQDLLGVFGIWIVANLTFENLVAQVLSDNGALPHAEFFERGPFDRRPHAAPVDALDIEIRNLCLGKTGHDFLTFDRVGVIPSRSFVNLVAEGTGHHFFLSLGKVCKTGIGVRFTDFAPINIGIAVVGQRTLGEVAEHLLTERCIVVVKLDRQFFRQDSGQGINNNGLLGSRQILEQSLVGRLFDVSPGIQGNSVIIEVIAQIINDNQLLVRAQRVEYNTLDRQSFRRDSSQIINDNQLLVRAQQVESNALEQQSFIDSGQVINDNGLLGSRQILEQRLVGRFIDVSPGNQGNSVVIEVIAKIINDNQLLFRAQQVESYTRGRCRNPLPGPVDQIVAVINGIALLKGSEQLLVRRGISPVENHPLVGRVSGLGGKHRTFGQVGTELTGSFVVISAFRVNGVAQRFSDLDFGFVTQ